MKRAVRMRRLRAGLFRRSPASNRLPLPVEALGRRLVGHALPPHAALGRQRDVGEDRVSARASPSRSGWSSIDVPGATPKKPASGLIARRRPLASGLIQAMSSPTVQTFQPFECAWRNQHREIGLAAGARKRRRHVGLLPLRDPRRRGSACAPPSSLRRARCSRRCAARSTSCRAARCRHSPIRSDQISRVSGKWTMYFSLLHGHGTSVLPGASGAPTVCMHGHHALLVLVDLLVTPAGRCAP